MDNSGGRMAVTITKQELSALPAMTYEGRVVMVDSLEKAELAVAELKGEITLGFDTETKPSFKRGQMNKVALMQIATRSCCYLFRLNKIGIPDGLRSILEDSNILKIGVSIHDDFHNLKKITDIQPEGFLDLQSFVKGYHIADNSLSRIYGILFNKRISKGQRLTNWEAAELTPFQQAYAALDAAACIQIYDYLIEDKFSAQNSIYWRDITPPSPSSKEAVKP